MTENEILRDLWTASWMSKGQPPSDNDKAYWLENSRGMLERGPQIRHRSPVFPEFDAGRAYQMDRMLGWQSGGADVPPFGKWANPPTAYHAVPPFPGDAGGSTAPGAGTTGASPSSPSPEPPATPLPPAPDTSSSDLATVLARMNTRFDRLEQLVDRPLTGTVKLPAVIGGGSRVITLRPVNAPPVTPRGKPGDGA